MKELQRVVEYYRVVEGSRKLKKVDRIAKLIKELILRDTLRAAIPIVGYGSYVKRK